MRYDVEPRREFAGLLSGNFGVNLSQVDAITPKFAKRTNFAKIRFMLLSDKFRLKCRQKYFAHGMLKLEAAGTYILC